MGIVFGGGRLSSQLTPLAGHDGLIELYMGLGTVETVLLHVTATLVLSPL
ncbi:MAG: hypothetical protein U5K37_05730 [Natrialbaceae archaeon]|nr:hypothetical protein [Natrialbaceae archaeon]